jgi:hypothetical protein
MGGGMGGGWVEAWEEESVGGWEEVWEPIKQEEILNLSSAKTFILGGARIKNAQECTNSLRTIVYPGQYSSARLQCTSTQT